MRNRWALFGTYSICFAYFVLKIIHPFLPILVLIYSIDDSNQDDLVNLVTNFENIFLWDYLLDIYLHYFVMTMSLNRTQN